MTHGGHYQKMSPDSAGSDICPVHRLLNYPKLVAQMDAEKIRNEATADTPPSRALANPCPGTDNWHIYIPTKARMKALRKRARQTRGQSDVPRETKEN